MVSMIYSRCQHDILNGYLLLYQILQEAAQMMSFEMATSALQALALLLTCASTASGEWHLLPNAKPW